MISACRASAASLARARGVAAVSARSSLTRSSAQRGCSSFTLLPCNRLSRANRLQPISRRLAESGDRDEHRVLPPGNYHVAARGDLFADHLIENICARKPGPGIFSLKTSECAISSPRSPARRRANGIAEKRVSPFRLAGAINSSEQGRIGNVPDQAIPRIVIRAAQKGKERR